MNQGNKGFRGITTIRIHNAIVWAGVAWVFVGLIAIAFALPVPASFGP